MFLTVSFCRTYRCITYVMGNISVIISLCIALSESKLCTTKQECRSLLTIAKDEERLREYCGNRHLELKRCQFLLTRKILKMEAAEKNE